MKEITGGVNLYNNGILRLMPENFKSLPGIRALSYAIKCERKRHMDTLRNSMVRADIDRIPEAALDEMAAELNVPYYDATMPIQTKRRIIRGAVGIYRNLGTRKAVEDMVDTVIGEGGRVLEWWEYNGTPGTFRISTPEVVTQEQAVQFSKLLRRVKNARSTLDMLYTNWIMDGADDVKIGAARTEAQIWRMRTAGVADNIFMS